MYNNTTGGANDNHDLMFKDRFNICTVVTGGANDNHYDLMFKDRFNICTVITGGARVQRVLPYKQLHRHATPHREHSHHAAKAEQNQPGQVPHDPRLVPEGDPSVSLHVQQGVPGRDGRLGHQGILTEEQI